MKNRAVSTILPGRRTLRTMAAMTLLLAALTAAGPANAVVPVAVPAAAVREAVEAAVRLSGKKALSAAARESAERVLWEATARHGAEVLSTAAKGGVEIIELATRHGDDVWRLCAGAGPAGIRGLALHPDTLLPLARRIGPEVIRLEDAAPGLTVRAAKLFGDDAVRVLARSPRKEDLPRLIGLAERADNPKTAKLLFEKWAENGGKIPGALNWKTVTAGGLSTAMIVAAYRVSGGVQGGMDEVSKAVSDLIRAAADSLPLILGVLALLAVVFLLARSARHRRGRATTGGPPPERVTEN